MSNRPNSSAHESSSEQSLPPTTVPSSVKVTGHPVEWTLSREWTIENRQSYDVWKMDAQRQMLYLNHTLNKSLHLYPHPEVCEVKDSSYSKDILRQSSSHPQINKRHRQVHPDIC
ncbi:uncharacterized protein LOC106055814 [Biomphalaria glabrata]|uniref:Uncharacterized protein LOC106055814 n=1 Tax=Biomphalaria glabrata TaxID=6526 RepID=A0A9W2ZLA7_BIOGL|nr:uncharacterized protein LOC106055814 [Biomphalaria glabrata]